MEDGKTKATGFECILPDGSRLFVGKMTDITGRDGYAIEIIREAPEPILPTCRSSYENGEIKTQIALTGDVLDAIAMLRQRIYAHDMIQWTIDKGVDVKFNIVQSPIEP